MASAIDFSKYKIYDTSTYEGLARGLEQLGLGLGRTRREEQQREAVLNEARRIEDHKARGYALMEARNIEDPIEQRKLITLMAQDAVQRGEDAEVYQQMLNITDPDELNLAIMRQATTDLARGGADDVLEGMFDPSDPTKNQISGSALVKDNVGNLFSVATKFDPYSGRVDPVITPIGHNNQPDGQLTRVGSTGMTGAERIESETDALRDRVDIEANKAGKVAAAKTKEQRMSAAIDLGIDSARTLPNVRRAIQLLDSVRTGGFNQAMLKAKQILGTETANEAELSNLLGKAVLSQLKATFGAQFTDNEGNRLNAIEANYGKSVEGNKRILQRLARTLEQRAKQGIKAADASEDPYSSSVINDWMAFDLVPDQELPTIEGEGQTMTPEQQQRLQQLRNQQGGNQVGR